MTKGQAGSLVGECMGVRCTRYKFVCTHCEFAKYQNVVGVATRYLDGLYGDQIPVRVTFFTPIQTGTGDPPNLLYTYQLQQGDKTHHTKHTTTHPKVTLMLKHPSLQNKTTDVVIQQHSRKLLKVDILMSETC